MCWNQASGPCLQNQQLLVYCVPKSSVSYKDGIYNIQID